MHFPKLTALILAASLSAAPAIAWAQASTLVLVIGGEAYDGPPKFSVTLGGKPVGEGSVAKAIDTGTDKRFADADDKTVHVESFSFDVPEADFAATGDIRIRLTNEAFGGEGSNRDRNLFVSSVSLNGVEIKAGSLVTNSKAGIKPNTMVGDYLLLADGSEEAMALAPTGGWPVAGAAPEATKPAEPEAKPAPAPEVKAEPVAPAPETAKPVEPAPEPAAPAEEPVKAPEPATKPKEPAARAEAKPSSSGTCAFEEAVQIIGFNENSNDLTKRVMGELDKIAEKIGDEECSILLTGYSSTQGSYSVNALFAVERAQNALKYLRDSGLKFKGAQATGAGETSQFGEDFRANRRVVVTVTP